MKKRENLLVLGMLSLIIALILEIFGKASILVDFLALFFIGVAIYSNARYIVVTSLEHKKK